MGADTLWGSSDVMSGPDGIDTFVFHAPEVGGDTIRDFVARQDRLEVSAAGFRGDLVPGFAITLTSGVNPTPIGLGSQILYDTATGRVIWEVDGAGPLAPVQIVTLANRPSITAAPATTTASAPASISRAEASMTAASCPPSRR